MKNSKRLILFLAVLALGGAIGAFVLSTQSANPSPNELEACHIVFPQAERFSKQRNFLPWTQSFPHYKAYQRDPQTGKDTLIGITFLTTDIEPEERGYNGPIEMMVGLDTSGTITGIHILSHSETATYMKNLEGFLKQFASIPFSRELSVGKDIDAMSGATITSEAIVRIIRKCVRKVASQILHLKAKALPEETITVPQTEKVEKHFRDIGITPHDARYWKDLK